MKLETFIGAEADFLGDLKVKGTVRIDGSLSGNVQADYAVLGETAFVRGEIAAERIVVGGKIEGTLKARESVEIQSRGKVFGDILTRRFSVLEGGEFNGRIDMKTDELPDLGLKEGMAEKAEL